MATKNKTCGTAETPREKIMEAAIARFAYYGFGKTTMAEIAKDCGMSAANIYRFFENKKDVAAALAEGFFQATQERLGEVVSQTGLTASEKLKAYFLELLSTTLEMIQDNPKILELADFVSNERLDLVEKKLTGQISQIAAIVGEGARTGEFSDCDTEQTASHISNALKFINYPPLAMAMLALGADLQKETEGVVALLVKGLKK